jgi:deoxyribodipyrimidine photo-lyase
VWFRLDLRLADNPALQAASALGGPVIPVYVAATDDEPADGWAPGAASRLWLHHSLASLDEALRARGSRLIVRPARSGATLQTLAALVEETGAGAITWNRRYEPAAIARDRAIKAALRAQGVEVATFNSSLLHEPWTVQTRDQRPYQVFTPFWKACLQAPEPLRPQDAPTAIAAPTRWPASTELATLKLQPRVNWATGIRAAWRPGEAGARERLLALCDHRVDDYAGQRDRPAVAGTSQLSPHLHFGEIGPRQIWHALRERADTSPTTGRPTMRAGAERQEDGTGAYLRELGWREFAHHLLFHFPSTPERPLRPSYQAFPWLSSRDDLRAWQRGLTGYPLVDAGMRQLWSTGWMHNRVRMIVASFLVKDLLLPWQAGARWFWDTLVDADLAQNTLGWQWSAGCGADATPYFRIFNPVTQGRRFDPDGDYVRRWVPELAGLQGGTIHAPWELSAADRSRAGITLGQTYPQRIVDHAWARDRALAALGTIRGPRTNPGVDDRSSALGSTWQS